MTPVPVLEIGGTHVTAAMVDLTRGQVLPRSVGRRPLDGDAPAGELLEQVLTCARTLPAPPGAAWGVAVPGPFDYESGVARFESVGKFDALNGVDVGAVLRRDLPQRPRRVDFVNDAIAFTVGEWAFGAGSGHERMVGITLGSGVGSGFLRNGVPVATGPEVPDRGEVYRLRIDGSPLEETVSRRALLRAYAPHAPQAPATDVREIASRARNGDPAAQLVLRDAFTALGVALAPWLSRFHATALVVGGSISRSWDVIHEPLVSGINCRERLVPERLDVLRARSSEQSPLLGAAWHSRKGSPRGVDRRGPAGLYRLHGHPPFRG